jgi:hypothetical protein
MPGSVGETIMKLGGHQNPLTNILLERSCWQAGVEHISEVMQQAEQANLGGLVEAITCPTLCLASEGESDEQLTQARELYEVLTAAKQWRLFTAEEGADAHCQVNNLGLMQQVVFDWLDEVLSPAPGEAKERPGAER